MTKPFQIGDRVAYSAVFLRAMGPSTGGQIDRLRGTVMGFIEDEPNLAIVLWDHPRERRASNVFNLVHADPAHLCNEATMADSHSGNGPDTVRP